MSSTNRGSKRVENDFYETPSWCVEAILPHLPLGGSVLDPCAGMGAILRVVEDEFNEVFAYEINPEFQPKDNFWPIEWVTVDSLAIPGWLHADVVLMNPPFAKAERFVARSVEQQAIMHGTTCALLRLSFLASKKRKEFLIANPCDVFVLSKRPSFNGIGTDSCDYAWFVWGPGRGGRWSVL